MAHIKCIRNHPVLIRSAKTFLQAFVGYLAGVGLYDFDLTSRSVWTGLLTSALAAGLAALMNVDWGGMEDGGGDTHE